MKKKKDWNAFFAEQKKAQDEAKANTLAEAKKAAKGTGKEPFDRRRFKKLYTKLNPDDVVTHAVWKSLLVESEYDYYVRCPDKNTLEEFIKYQDWVDGFG